MYSYKNFTLVTLLSGTALCCAPDAHAQSAQVAASSTASEEVIVTAQKRASTVQETPISITAVSGEELQDRGITNFTSLAGDTPGVSMKTEGPGQTEIEMRGMTSSGGNSATVGFYLDDIPMTAPAGAQNGKVVIDPSLYDLSRVEVLRGPQGTLYGSGSMGGTVRLITNQPDLMDYHGSAESVLSGTEGGGLNHDNNFMLNIPLVQDRLAVRVVGTEAYTSGWIDRIVANPFPLVSTDGSTRGNVQAAPIEKQYPGSNDGQLYGTRITLLWQPTDNLTITPSFFYQRDKQNGISAFDSNPGTETRYQPFDIAEPNADKIDVYSLTAKYAFEDFDVTSVTSYWKRFSNQTEDGSEDFNNPLTGVTFASNNGLANPGYYGPTGTGKVYGTVASGRPGISTASPPTPAPTWTSARFSRRRRPNGSMHRHRPRSANMLCLAKAPTRSPTGSRPRSVCAATPTIINSPPASAAGAPDWGRRHRRLPTSRNPRPA